MYLALPSRCLCPPWFVFFVCFFLVLLFSVYVTRDLYVFWGVCVLYIFRHVLLTFSKICLKTGSNFRCWCALSKGGVRDPEVAHPRRKIGEEPPPPPGAEGSMSLVWHAFRLNCLSYYFPCIWPCHPSVSVRRDLYVFFCLFFSPPIFRVSGIAIPMSRSPRICIWTGPIWLPRGQPGHIQLHVRSGPIPFGRV